MSEHTETYQLINRKKKKEENGWGDIKAPFTTKEKEEKEND